MGILSSNKVIEVSVNSVENSFVNKFGKPAKKNVSVTVRTDPSISRSTARTDPDCPGPYPVWNQKMVMDLPAHARFLTIEAYYGWKVIGAAKIPVSDFSGGPLPENYWSFLSYRLRDAGGAKNGIVNLSVKLVGGSGGDQGCAASCSRPSDKKVKGDVVMGIPVPYST